MSHAGPVRRKHRLEPVPPAILLLTCRSPSRGPSRRSDGGCRDRPDRVFPLRRVRPRTPPPEKAADHLPTGRGGVRRREGRRSGGRRAARRARRRRSGRRHDREASNHVALAHDAAASAGRYHKRLLPKAAFAALTATVSEARTKHYENTLPWDDQGWRLLTVANYEHYTAFMDGLRERMVRERARFIEDYDDHIDQARLGLGRLFRIDDYPSKEALQGKFSLRYRITEVSDPEHFMAKLATDDVTRILCHNHPSGEPEPSHADRILTDQLVAALATVEVRVLDHLVIGDAACVSFSERGLL